MQPANTWLEFAHEDFLAAKKLWPEQFAIACFHLQQTWEKCFKAILIHEGSGLHKTHDIRFLAKNLSFLPDQWDDYLDTLSRFYTTSRYPASNKKLEEEYSKELIEELFIQTQEVIGWTKQQLDNT